MAAGAEARVQQRLRPKLSEQLNCVKGSAGGCVEHSEGSTQGRAVWTELSRRWHAGREAVTLTTEERFGISHELLLQAMPFRSLHNPRRLNFAWGITMLIFVLASSFVILYSLFPCEEPRITEEILAANATFGDTAIATALPDQYVQANYSTSLVNGSLSNRTTSSSEATRACLQRPDTWFDVVRAWLLALIIEFTINDPLLILGVLLTKTYLPLFLCHELIFKNRAVFVCCYPITWVHKHISHGLGGFLGLL